jgi:hypothetical protein
MFCPKIGLLSIYTSIIIYGLFISIGTNYMPWYISATVFSYLLMARFFYYSLNERAIRSRIIDIAMLLYIIAMILSGIVITSSVETTSLQIMTICLTIFYLFFLVIYILFAIVYRELNNMIFPYNKVEEILFQNEVVYFNNTCPICLVDFNNKEKIYQIIECKHLYHYQCINDVLTHNNFCSLCKHEIV